MLTQSGNSAGCCTLGTATDRCVMSPSSGLPGRTVSALELQGGDLGSIQKGLAGAGHSGSPWPGWLCRVAAGFGCSDGAGVAQGERRSLHIAPLPALGHPTNPPGAERLLWYHFQWEGVSSQPAGSQLGCGGIFWVRLCRELLKCFVLMMMMIIIIFFPTETFLE